MKYRKGHFNGRDDPLSIKGIDSFEGNFDSGRAIPYIRFYLNAVEPDHLGEGV
jgi:hypothetical protein